MKVLLLIISLAIYASSQGCLNPLGVEVDWWVILKVPPKTGNIGFGYYDSTYQTSTFEYNENPVDQGSTALNLTLNQINDLWLEAVAWNDQKPSNQTSSSQAHSKGVISYSAANKKGFYLSHSIPQYPSFINHLVNGTVGESQSYYGQHLMCVQMTLAGLNQLAQRFMAIRPYVYENSIINSTYTNFLFDMASSKTDKTSPCFLTQTFNIKPDFTLRGIFKSGYLNCSIFEDAMVTDLKVNVTAETWGRPLLPAWCNNGYQVNNVLNVAVGPVTWKETQDHSKWALAENKYACFGDTNRMASQWKRGGSFFCFDNPSLVEALRKVIVLTDSC